MKNLNFEKENDYLNLTMQQKFNFDSNTFDEENTKAYKKNSNARKKENQRMRELIKIKEKYKKKYYISLILVLILILAVIVVSVLFMYRKPKIEEKIVEKYKVPENILFLGDSITECYDLDKYYDGFNIVNSGISGNKTYDILNNMKERVYKYNPSKIFILIGTNDFLENKTNEEIINNIKKIINEISKNRPESKIYLESIYPVNNTDDEKVNHSVVKNRKNEDIKKINKQLKKFSEKKKIVYIDMYSLLEDKDGNLKINYTKEGLHMSDEGYDVITKKIKEYLK
ncbi:MAG: GDSL-type esterase/lipase family protein [bacterium]|nr:GDSL-type esterase/lipase family protein [bacterium]